MSLVGLPLVTPVVGDDSSNPLRKRVDANGSSGAKPIPNGKNLCHLKILCNFLSNPHRHLPMVHLQTVLALPCPHHVGIVLLSISSRCSYIKSRFFSFIILLVIERCIYRKNNVHQQGWSYSSARIRYFQIITPPHSFFSCYCCCSTKMSLRLLVVKRKQGSSTVTELTAPSAHPLISPSSQTHLPPPPPPHPTSGLSPLHQIFCPS